MTIEQAPAPRSHRLHRFSGRLHEVLDDLDFPATWTMSHDERAETVAELSRALPRIQALLLALVADADRADTATTTGATSTAGWLKGLTRATGPDATGSVRTARALETRPATQSALATGSINLDQAREILHALDQLPDDLPADDLAHAQAHLLAEAAHHDARTLRMLGKHLLEVIDPDAAEEHLASRLEREEAEARRRCSFTTHHDGNGSLHGKFKIPTMYGAMLTTMLQALANPGRPDPIERSTTPQVLGQAFCQLLERYPADRLPTTGGVNATVVVTLSLETLRGGLQCAQILGHGPLSPGEARRLACAAGIIPAVLGTRSEVLDLGRRARLHTKAQRIAMTLQQDGTCAVDGCDRPSTWADAHHLQPWSAAGPTTVDNGVLICPRHHTLAHDNHLTVTRLGTGKLRFHRRT
jgi:hypothetical protein